MTLTRQELNERVEVLREEISNLRRNDYQGTDEMKERENELASINSALWRSANMDNPEFEIHMMTGFRYYSIVQRKELQERKIETHITSKTVGDVQDKLFYIFRKDCMEDDEVQKAHSYLQEKLNEKRHQLRRLEEN